MITDFRDNDFWLFCKCALKQPKPVVGFIGIYSRDYLLLSKIIPCWLKYSWWSSHAIHLYSFKRSGLIRRISQYIAYQCEIKFVAIFKREWECNYENLELRVVAVEMSSRLWRTKKNCHFACDAAPTTSSRPKTCPVAQKLRIIVSLADFPWRMVARDALEWASKSTENIWNSDYGESLTAN